MLFAAIFSPLRWLDFAFFFFSLLTSFFSTGASSPRDTTLALRFSLFFVPGRCIVRLYRRRQEDLLEELRRV